MENNQEQAIPAEELERIEIDSDTLPPNSFQSKTDARRFGYREGAKAEWLRAHSSQSDEKKIHPVYKGWNSLKLIGRVKDRFQELIRKGWDWTGFYHGWLEGRAEMIQEMKEEWDAPSLQPPTPTVEREKRENLILFLDWWLLNYMKAKGATPNSSAIVVDRYLSESK